jgi:hypothetical protein
MMSRAKEEVLGLSYREKVDDAEGHGGGLRADLS